MMAAIQTHAIVALSRRAVVSLLSNLIKSTTALRHC